MTRTKQGGSVLNFIIVGAVLAVLLAVGVYIVRQHTVQPTDDPLHEEGVVVIEDEEKIEESAPQEIAQELPGTDEAAVQEHLPETGPGETLGAVFIVGIMSVAVTSYWRSRQPELSL